MSVVEVTEKHAAKGANVSDDGTRTYTRVYIVRTDNAKDDERLILLASGLPRIGNVLAADLGARCTSKVPRQTGSDKDWEVTCTFSTDSEDPTTSARAKPTERPTVIRWGFVESAVTFDADLDDPEKPYRNTFGDFFDPPPKRIEYLLTVTITRNEAAYDPEAAEQYAGVVNDAPWWTFKKHEALMLPWAAASRYEDGENFWEVVYEIRFNRKLWIPTKILNRGGQYWKSKVDGNDKPTGVPDTIGVFPRKIAQVAEDDEGVKHDGIVLLNQAGCKLPEGHAPHFVEFIDYEERDFDKLNLP